MHLLVDSTCSSETNALMKIAAQKFGYTESFANFAL